MITPPFLQKGDKIAIVSTARKIELSEITPAVELLKQSGFVVEMGKSIGAVQNQFAGNDELRAKDFQAFLNDDSVKAIVCARGGYGTMRIIDALDFSGLKKNPKWVVGYSDITVLHSHLQQNVGVKSIHGTMPINFPKENKNDAVETLLNALSGKLSAHEYKTENPLNRNGIAQGMLTGGNLSLLYALQGSKTDINTDGKILFIEDLDEYLYHIDRMMLSLKRAGKLDKLKGLIVGGMTDMKDNTVPFGKTAEQIILDTIKEFDFPVCFDFPAGHIENNLALIMGQEVKLNVGKTVKLTF